jgi:hypothetical protein
LKKKKKKKKRRPRQTLLLETALRLRRFTLHRGKTKERKKERVFSVWSLSLFETRRKVEN